MCSVVVVVDAITNPVCHHLRQRPDPLRSRDQDGTRCQRLIHSRPLGTSVTSESGPPPTGSIIFWSANSPGLCCTTRGVPIRAFLSSGMCQRGGPRRWASQTAGPRRSPSPPGVPVTPLRIPSAGWRCGCCIDAIIDICRPSASWIPMLPSWWNAHWSGHRVARLMPHPLRSAG